MKPLNARQLNVLRNAPIAVDVDHGCGDPHISPKFIYHNADGRIASALWTKGLLSYRAVDPDGKQGGFLNLTPAGRHALSQTDRGGER